MRFIACLTAFAAVAQQPATRPPRAPYRIESPVALAGDESGGLRHLIERYRADRGSLGRFYDQALSPMTDRAMREFYAEWRRTLAALDFAKLDQHAKVDHVLLNNRISLEMARLDLQKRRIDEMLPLLPFLPSLMDMKEGRQRVDPLEGARAAALLVQTSKQLGELTQWVTAKSGGPAVDRSTARRAAAAIETLRNVLKEWHQFRASYDPEFTWWTTDPYKRLDQDLQKYAALIRERLVGVSKEDRDTIIGDPIGRDALLEELRHELIAYTPDELVAIAEREFAWCDREMLRASRDLGFGDDWKRALEHVKTLHVAPGKQTALILEQAVEAIQYLRQHDLVTVPPLAADTWRVEMMSPEQQRISPFFLGGEVIRVSFPTDTMTHEEKMMSMRGNNIHFSRATVHHELIPGHYLQQFMTARHRAYRSQMFTTPFWTEGLALYWEMFLWDHGFAKSPENRIGMLFWRMHRCARILFSLNFHLGKWTPQQCVDFLVNRVGHEYANASAEVRRSFEGNYPPLYQAAYMLGGLQFRALQKELVTSGKMKVRDFHDALYKLNNIPVEMVRATLVNAPLSPDFRSTWRFAD